MDALERAGVLCRELRRAVWLGETCGELFRWLRELVPDRAEYVAEAFRLALPGLRETLRRDIQAALEGDPAAVSEAEVQLSYPGFRAAEVQRMAHIPWELEVPLLPRLMTEHAHSITGIDIHPGAKIGNWFFIDHGTGVVIGETAEIGDHVKLYQGVTLGGLSTRDAEALRGKKRHPTIGSHVTVYANATILGGDTVIGDGCVIGANVFLTGSVPPHTTVRMKAQELEFRESKL